MACILQGRIKTMVCNTCTRTRQGGREGEREREREGVCVQWGQQRREIQCPTTTLVILNQTLAAPALSIIIAHEPQWKNSGCIFYCLPYNWYNLQTYVTTDDILLKFQSTTNEKKKKKGSLPIAFPPSELWQKNALIALLQPLLLHPTGGISMEALLFLHVIIAQTLGANQTLTPTLLVKRRFQSPHPLPMLPITLALLLSRPAASLSLLLPPTS